MQVRQLSMQRIILVLVVTSMALDGGWWCPCPISLTSAFSAVTPSSSFSSSKAGALLPSCPPVSPATGLENRVYEWKHGQRIRYQQTNHHSNNKKNAAPILLVHGLFVNSDHWRHTLRDLDEAGYNAFALDLFGCGYSDKPPAMSKVAQLCNGERGRFDDDEHPSVLKNVELGTPDGRRTRVVDVDLRHPLGSPYNFYTWAEQIVDFCEDVVLKEEPTQQQKVTLVCNSIGTISSLQAVLDRPDLFQGVFAVSPNFRELHSAEVPYSQVTMVVLRAIQRLLRERGQPVFDALAKPDTVKEILKVPYVIDSAVDDALVEVLLDPLLTPGSSQVVFDLLSYSAGPLPEQQLQELSSAEAAPSTTTPVWIVYGDRDPWTPGPRVEALQKYAAVERVEPLAGVGHCPHDEAPQMLIDNSRGGGLLLEFLQRLEKPSSKKE